MAYILASEYTSSEDFKPKIEAGSNRDPPTMAYALPSEYPVSKDFRPKIEPDSIYNTYSSPAPLYQPTSFKNCYMSSKYPVHTTKEPDCFCTTVYIADSQIYGAPVTRGLAISGVLLDSGATNNSISRDAVNKLGFLTQRVAPCTTELADGRIRSKDEIVYFRLCIKGVRCWIRAYVVDDKSSTILVLGMEGFRAYRMDFHGAHGTGRKVRSKVKIADVESGNLRRVLEVEEDKAGMGSRMWWVEPESTWFRKLSKGMTAKEEKEAKGVKEAKKANGAKEAKGTAKKVVGFSDPLASWLTETRTSI